MTYSKIAHIIKTWKGKRCFLGVLLPFLSTQQKELMSTITQFQILAKDLKRGDFVEIEVRYQIVPAQVVEVYLKPRSVSVVLKYKNSDYHWGGEAHKTFKLKDVLDIPF